MTSLIIDLEIKYAKIFLSFGRYDDENLHA